MYVYIYKCNVNMLYDGRSIKIWDLESKSVVAELAPEDIPPTGPKALRVACVSLCWSADGNWLYSGYTDGAIRVWGVSVR